MGVWLNLMKKCERSNCSLKLEVCMDRADSPVVLLLNLQVDPLNDKLAQEPLQPTSLTFMGQAKGNLYFNLSPQLTISNVAAQNYTQIANILTQADCQGAA